MADQQQPPQAPDFWAQLGAGMRDAGAILSPEVYRSQSEERQHTLINVARSLEIKKAQRSLDADTRFGEVTKGLQPSAMDSESLLEVAKKIPIDVLAESPRAQQFLQLTSQVQAREAQAQARQDAIDAKVMQVEQMRDAAKDRATNTSLSLQIRADAEKRMTHYENELLRLREMDIKQRGDGGTGAQMVQDPDTGQVYQVNQRSGKAWSFDEEGKRTEIPVTNLPKKLTKVGGIGTAGAREAVFTQRLIQAGNQASKDLENVVKLPMSSDRGAFGAFGSVTAPNFMDATKAVLGNKMTSEESQIYNAMSTGFQRTLAAIEAAGLMPSGSLTHQMDAVIFKPGDTNMAKLHKLAQTRQIVESGMEVILTNPRISDAEKGKVKEIVARLEKAVPFTHSDLVDMMVAQKANPKVTLRQVIDAKLNKKPDGEGTPKPAVAAAAPAATNAQGWKLMVDAKGNKAYVGPKGEVEEVK